MGTCSVDFARHASALHHQHDVGYVSAPVFGRTEAAAAGTLNILASGESHLVDHVEPLFAVLGQRTWRLGDDPRHAVIAKIAGNFMIASTIESFAEACALGEANGVAPTDLVPVLTGTLFPGPVHANYGAMVAEHRYEPAGFALPLGLKDVNLALAAGAGAHVPLPFASVLRDAFLDAIAHGDAQKDWAAVAAVARRRASLPRP
jgi:3-hydroxyisobutyrate dehydrogenase-like beta-hydroxyacid dehydrogenase